MPRRPALPSEKIMAVAGIYKALGQELHMHLTNEDVRVQVALLNAAVAIGLSTNTADMGILAAPPVPMQPTGSDGMDVVGDEPVPCDDCGALPGQPHDMSIEH